MNDETTMNEGAALSVASGEHDAVRWHCHTKVEKYDLTDADRADLDMLSGEDQVALAKALGVDAEVVEIEGNLLMYGGASVLWQALIGNGTATADQALTYFNNARAAIGVGDSTTAAAATHTNLQAATNKLRKAMDSTYPQHTDATTSGAASIVFRSTFATGDANWAWQEWGVFNSATDATGRMLQRKVESLGTKTSAAAWTLTVTLTLA
jgi:hypothetical protein